jgi:uracil-DNA glycosylase family 4
MNTALIEELNRGLVACRDCLRLVDWREQVAREKRRAYRDWDYWGKPVPGFGDPQARVMVVGLAPGAHGSNRTGRMFTGDASGDFLYPALYRAGFASQPDSFFSTDGLTLHGLYITAVGRCAPPGNKPTPAELDNCQPYLQRELELIRPKVLVALGRIAFERLLRIYSIPANSLTFAHGALHSLDTDRWLLCSYHPSRQNTQTGRLTVEMFDTIWSKVRELLQA